MELGMLVGFMGTLVVAFAGLLVVTAARGGGAGPVSEWRISPAERREMAGGGSLEGGDPRA
jgi:hypothetical protein